MQIDPQHDVYGHMSTGDGAADDSRAAEDEDTVTLGTWSPKPWQLVYGDKKISFHMLTSFNALTVLSMTLRLYLDSESTEIN